MKKVVLTSLSSIAACSCVVLSLERPRVQWSYLPLFWFGGARGPKGRTVENLKISCNIRYIVARWRWHESTYFPRQTLLIWCSGVGSFRSLALFESFLAIKTNSYNAAWYKDLFSFFSVDRHHYQNKKLHKINVIVQYLHGLSYIIIYYVIRRNSYRIHCISNVIDVYWMVHSGEK